MKVACSQKLVSTYLASQCQKPGDHNVNLFGKNHKNKSDLTYICLLVLNRIGKQFSVTPFMFFVGRSGLEHRTKEDLKMRKIKWGGGGVFLWVLLNKGFFFSGENFWGGGGFQIVQK